MLLLKYIKIERKEVYVNKPRGYCTLTENSLTTSITRFSFEETLNGGLFTAVYKHSFGYPSEKKQAESVYLMIFTASPFPQETLETIKESDVFLSHL